VIFKNLFSKLDKVKAKILILNTLVALILLNLIANKLNWRLDLTANKIHSLSPATKNIIKNLDDIVTIEVFASEEIPEQLIPLKNNLFWFVQTYEKLGKGKIKVKFSDPSKDKKAQERAVQLGISPIEFSTLKRDKFEVTKGWLALVVSYGDKNEIISALQELPNLEYRLTAAIKKVTQEEEKTVAFTVGHQETSLEELKLVQKALEQHYRWEVTRLKGDDARFNEKVDVLIVNGPKEEFSKEEKILLDQYLQHQKGLLFLLDEYDVDRNLFSSPAKHDLEDLLTHYGIKPEKKMILSQSAALAGFRTEQGGIIVPYPYWIQIQPQGFNRQLPPTSSLGNLTLMWSSPLALEKDAQWLVKTPPASWEEEGTFNLDPTQKISPPSEDKQKEFILAAIQTTPQPSFFSQPDKKTQEKLNLKNWEKGGEKNIKLAVVGDSDFLKDIFVQNHQGNLQFLLNLVDFLAQEKDLISIRSKPVITRPLRPVGNNSKQIVKFGNLLTPVFLAAVTFLLVKISREKKLKKITENIS